MFKYAKVDEHTLDNLRKRQLYCRHYQDFNDPFECWVEERSDVPDVLVQTERFNAVVKAWGYDVDPSSETDMAMYREYVASLVDYPWSKYQLTLESARIACFCRRADNLLMWAHYADGMRGLCVEFDREAIRAGHAQRRSPPRRALR